VPHLEFRLLGPVEVTDRTGPVPLGGAPGQRILAALLLDADRVVSVEQLVAAAWGERPPATARVQVQNRVSALRRRLDPEGSRPGRIATAGSGYVIHVDEDHLDLHRFDRLVSWAEERVAEGGYEKATTLLREALGLWRGPALDLARTPALEAAARSLEETRARALERRMALDLVAGSHGEMLAELTAATLAHPYRERLWAYLMLAQYRAGRRADALDTFRQTRVRLTEELGVEPGSDLQKLHEAILRGDDALAETSAIGRWAAVSRAGSAAGPGEAPAPARRPRSAPVPRQLPRDVSGFTGRAGELAMLDALLTETGEDGRTGGVAVIAGTAGVGKTALALHWAHGVADRFPDGQLYVNLLGFAPGTPMRPIHALAQFLRALSPQAEEQPCDEAEAAALYRSGLAGRRMLVVLDNACSVEQVRPLLPGSPGCLVLVTSRDRLGGLVAREGARRIALDVLPGDEAHALLGRILGYDRTRAEAAAVAELSTVCAHLPLALRIAAANILDGSPRTIADQVAALAENRLALLTVRGDEDAAVQAAFDLSYRSVPADARRLFRLLALVPGPDVTVGAAAALAGVGERDAAGLLDRLAGGHLIDQHRRGRYAFHDLLRRYAAEHAERDATESVAAAARLSGWYLRGADRAARLLFPDVLRLPTAAAGPDNGSIRFADRGAALAWLHAERNNLIAACVTLADGGPPRLAWLLAGALRGYLGRHGHRIDYRTVVSAALDAAIRDGDERAQAMLNHSLAHVHHSQGRHESAIECLEQAMVLSRRSGWSDSEGIAHSNLGIVYAETGRLDLAAQRFTTALRLVRDSGGTSGVGTILTNLGHLHRLQGRLELAAAELTEAIAAYERSGAASRAVEAQDSLGSALHELGRFTDALTRLEHCLVRCREAGNRSTEANVLYKLAAVHRDAGRHPVALRYAREALDLARELGFLLKEMDALNVLGTIHGALADHPAAEACHRAALRLTGEVYARSQAAEALVGLAEVYLALRRHPEALAYADEAVGVARPCGFRVIEGRAMTTTARLHLGLAAPAEAARHARSALDNHRATGYRLGQAHALVVLGHAVRELDGGGAAAPHWAAARSLFAALGVPLPCDLISGWSGSDTGRANKCQRAAN
jgi:DNA-binding SARP family transcriptional activator